MKNTIFFLSILFIFSQCTVVNKATKENAAFGLKDYYKNYFDIGVAVSANSLKDKNASLIFNEFNSLTAENSMKMGPIHPAENSYNWKDADSILAFALNNKLKIRGHNLCWHQQAPKWFFIDSLGKQVTKEVLLARLKKHIFDVVGRYKGKVYAWDVVNEAISDAPDEYLRNSAWYQIAGDEYIAKAFEYAHEADPAALLFYNDYNEISAIKRAKIIKLVKDLKAQGVPINGVGLQGHWAINEPSYAQLDSTLNDFSQLGLILQITELDMDAIKKNDVELIKKLTLSWLMGGVGSIDNQGIRRDGGTLELEIGHETYLGSLTHWQSFDNHALTGNNWLINHAKVLAKLSS